MNAEASLARNRATPGKSSAYPARPSGVIAATAFRHRSTLPSVALGLILGGALGNLTDRIVRGPEFSGRVVDFVDLHVWPIFNVADSAIVVGALLLAFGSLRSDRHEPDAASDAEASDRP